VSLHHWKIKGNAANQTGWLNDETRPHLGKLEGLFERINVTEEIGRKRFWVDSL